MKLYNGGLLNVTNVCHDITKILFFVHTGIECPRGSRNMPGGMQVAEPYSEEAMLFTKELVLQREVRLLFLLRSLILYRFCF